MSVKSLSITKWGNTIVIEPVAHWWKRLHLHYYDLGVGSDYLRKAAHSFFFQLLTRLLTQQTRCSTHQCVNGILFFPVSARVMSKLLLWPNKQTKDWWLQMMKLGKWGPKTHLQLPIITIGAGKDNKMKIFEIITSRQVQNTFIFVE